MENGIPAVKIDVNKCTNCKKCEADCLLTTYIGYKNIIDGDSKVCNLCGHCLASCEYDAITHFKLSNKDIRPLGKLPKPDEMLNLIIGRRSRRTFKEEKIKQDDWNKIIEAVRYSMTGCNIQDVDLIIIESKEVIKKIGNAIMEFDLILESQLADENISTNFEPQFGKLIINAFEKYDKKHDLQKKYKDDGNDFAVFNASSLIFFIGPKVNFSQVECLLATQAVALLAPTLGIGTCDNGTIPIAYSIGFPPFMEIVKEFLPEDKGIFSAMMVGYQEFEYTKIPFRNEKNVIYVK